MIYKISERVTVLGSAVQKPSISITFLGYLVRGEKNILIDTAPEKKAEAYLEELESQIDLREIDAVIQNHSEGDHSGALGKILPKLPGVPVYCTEACKKNLAGHFPDTEFIAVEDRSELQLGDLKFRFYHTPGLHWPDNMVTWLESENILFSNDLFGQYTAAEPPLDTELSEEVLLQGTESYFNKVFGPSSPEERQVIEEILALTPQTIAVGHGVILREKIHLVAEYYRSKIKG